MKRRSTGMGQWAVAGMTVILFAARAIAAGEVDLSALTQETQKVSQKGGDLTLVWWIPEEFWKASLAQNAGVSAAQSDDFLKVMKPYVAIAVVKGNVGLNPSFKSEKFVRSNTKVVDSRGNSYAPLADGDLDAKAKSVVGMLKPVFTSTLGPMGESMHIMLFRAKAADGTPVVDAKQKGEFKVTVADKEFRWRLPLDSLLPLQKCPKCKEEGKGSWTFCPWCGTKLAK